MALNSLNSNNVVRLKPVEKYVEMAVEKGKSNNELCYFNVFDKFAGKNEI